MTKSDAWLLFLLDNLVRHKLDMDFFYENAEFSKLIEYFVDCGYLTKSSVRRPHHDTGEKLWDPVLTKLALRRIRDHNLVP